MKIAVLGLGNIGGTLGAKWLHTGHEVRFGVRDIHSPKVQAFRSQHGEDNHISSFGQAINFGEVILLAVNSAAVPAIVAAHSNELDGKLIIDATNNVSAEDMSQVPLLAARTPGARVFRAFSNLGWENFAEPKFGHLQADLFYCGPEDAPARQTVEGLISDVGLRPIRVGGLEQVSLIDGLTRLWFALAHGQMMGRRLAFKVLTPEE